ncbi:hypothetical protein AMAG_14659 [Allomyces macrogynus ATCC 38327]|uniref:Uncharacterized protein n=1 Tax=Allomyces macrogynus (strain ATCC 38327) TaxID=578462 RepID=A0A0L0T775_ALLM3|nr:hypothetical protein AMAG_14659 [Allomyces macrogynus ATCC 38327]|eukprot:KNE70536.1 hypothetical protein AMAG_14659 [Allomyces macrogynus ATCC 38327]
MTCQHAETRRALSRTSTKWTTPQSIDLYRSYPLSLSTHPATNTLQPRAKFPISSTMSYQRDEFSNIPGSGDQTATNWGSNDEFASAHVTGGPGHAESSTAYFPPTETSGEGHAESSTAYFPPTETSGPGHAESSTAYFPPTETSGPGHAESSTAYFPPTATGGF